MNRLTPADLPSLLRRYRFPGGRLRAVRVAHRGRGPAVEFRLTVRPAVQNLADAPRPVHLRLRLDGVEEFRLQMRPNQSKAKVADARFGYLSGLFFVNLDAWGLEPGETAKVHDYRASEVYAAGRELWWEEVPPNARG